MRDIVRPSFASRPMSLSLAVYSCSLRVMKTNSCSLLDSPGTIFLGGRRHVFRVNCTTMGIADGGTVHREFHLQRRLAREDPKAAAAATGAWQATVLHRQTKDDLLPPPFIGDRRQEFR